jgi:hypothetical protein
MVFSRYGAVCSVDSFSTELKALDPVSPFAPGGPVLATPALPVRRRLLADDLERDRFANDIDNDVGWYFSSDLEVGHQSLLSSGP